MTDDIRVERRKLTDVLPDSQNANRHRQRGQAALERSLRARGFFRPTAAFGKGVAQPVMGAGNLTQETAVSIGMDEAIFVYTDGSTPIVHVRTDIAPGSPEAHALAIEDNRIAEISLDWDVETLLNVAPDELLTSLWEPEELSDLGAEWGNDAQADDPGPQIDRAAELQEHWKTATGQLWQLGEHRLIVGDCTDAATVARVMGGEKAGACVTDPPYGINREGIANDDPEGLRALFDGCLAVMPITDGVLIAFQSPRLEWVWLDATRAAGWHPERLLWMYKPNDETFPWRGWLLKSEAIRASSKGKAQWVDVHPYSHDCYSPTTLGQELSKNEGWHASVKPLAVVSDLVQRVGGIIYDPFSGSGTTLIACERLGRKCRAVEISPAYVAVAIQRWVDVKNGTPELIST